MRSVKIVLAVLLLVCSSVYGQFKRGSILLGGDIVFNTSKSENFISSTENKSHSFILSPVLGKAVKDNLFLGVSLGFGGARSTFDTNGDTKSKSYSGNIFVRKYKPVFGKINAFVQVGAGVSKNISETEQGPNYFQRSSAFITSASLAPGISVGMGKKLYIEAGFNNLLSLNYNTSKTTGNNFGSAINR